MVIQYGDDLFKNEWLEFVKHDPVHPSSPISKRISGNRTIFIYLHKMVPYFIICARIGNKIPRNMLEVLKDDGYTSIYDVKFAIFYSIFRLPNVNQKGVGTKAIKEVIKYCRKKILINTIP